jgi:hypothetical protein
MITKIKYLFAFFYNKLFITPYTCKYINYDCCKFETHHIEYILSRDTNITFIGIDFHLYE